MVVMVDHLQRMIMVQKDTTKMTEQSFLMSLDNYIDKTSSVEVETANKVVTYTCHYPTGQTYKFVKLSFSEKTKRLVSIYAEFSPDYPEPYSSIIVEYKAWDLNWKPDDGFPDFTKYIKKQSGKYQLQPAWNKYQLFQSN